MLGFDDDYDDETNYENYLWQDFAIQKQVAVFFTWS
jgi:hypothetical protein